VLFEGQPDTDYATTAMVGPLSTPIGYSNDVAPAAGQITALNLSNASVTADLVRGSYQYNVSAAPTISGVVGIVTTTNTLYRGTLDITLTNDASGAFAMKANRLVRGKTPLAAGTYNIDFLVTVRGSGVTKAFAAVPITVTAGTATADTNAETTTLAQYMFNPPAVGSSRRLAIDAYITALKSAGLWTKIKYMSWEATSDKRDAVINWKDPTQPDLYEVLGTIASSFTVDRGYTGVSGGWYLTKDSMFRGEELGLGQNDTTIIAGVTLQDATLPTGTDYIIGNERLNIAITTAGKLQGRVQSAGTLTTTGSAFVAGTATMRYLAWARNITASASAYYGGKGTSFAAAIETVASSSSATASVNQMRQHGRGNDQAGNRKQIHFCVLATYFAAADMDAFRSATDTFLTHLGIN
jgi:hypothetical protein